MGAVLNTAGAAEIAAELACCACSSVCGFVCKDHATRAKLRYCTILFFATIMCFVMLVPGMRRNFDRIPNVCGKLVTSDTCDKFFGFGAVYRVMLSMTTFYGIFALFTIRVTRINSFRARFNNGFWILKFVILLAITIGTFFIPKKSEFFRIWMYACLIGGFVFMLYQIVIVIDFGHSWSVSWAERLDTNNSKLWYLAMVLATLLMFTITLAAVATFYVLFAGKHALTRCKANTFYVTFIVIQCFLATVISVTPTVQQELAGAGLLQSSVVILYTSYLTYNTLSTEPDTTCNPLGKIILEYDKMSGINGEGLFGCLLTFALVIFACTVRAHTSQLGKYGLAISESEEYAMMTLMREQSRETKTKDNEQNEILLDDYVGYNYSLFHTIMALTSLYLLMILTNWHSPDQNSNMRRLVKNWASVWVQMASSFICILIYIWFLVTPLVRKIWAPLFGIEINEGDGSKGHRSEAAYSSKSQMSQMKIERNNESFKDGLNTQWSHADFEKDISDQFIVRGSDVSQGGGNDRNNEFKNGNEIEHNASGELKRYKSIESIKSAFSSITKRESRTKNDSAGKRSKILESCNERSEDKESEVIGQDEYQGEEGIEGFRSETKYRKKRGRMARFGSIESLRSGFSAISNASKRIKSKIRTKLRHKNSENKNSENVNTIERDSVASRLEQSFNNRNAKHCLKSIVNRTFDQSNSHEETYDSKSKHNSDGKDGGTESGPVNTLRSISPKQKTITDMRRTPVRNKVTEKYGNANENEERSEHMRKQVNESCAGATEGANERPHSTSSNYGSNTFKEKPQDPEVARELLRLQWKILRMQAKVVKIQEKIIRIQAEDDAAKKNAQEAAENLEPPIGQSSVVADSAYTRKRETLIEQQRKQQG